jgi:hypothetical protein
MNRDKPFRIQQATTHEKKQTAVSAIVEKKEDCNKPRAGKDNKK